MCWRSPRTSMTWSYRSGNHRRRPIDRRCRDRSATRHRFRERAAADPFFGDLPEVSAGDLRDLPAKRQLAASPPTASAPARTGCSSSITQKPMRFALPTVRKAAGCISMKRPGSTSNRQAVIAAGARSYTVPRFPPRCSPDRAIPDWPGPADPTTGDEARRAPPVSAQHHRHRRYPRGRPRR